MIEVKEKKHSTNSADLGERMKVQERGQEKLGDITSIEKTKKITPTRATPKGGEKKSAWGVLIRKAQSHEKQSMRTKRSHLRLRRSNKSSGRGSSPLQTVKKHEKRKDNK